MSNDRSRKRRLCVLLLTALVAGPIAGCGDDTSDPASDPRADAGTPDSGAPVGDGGVLDGGEATDATTPRPDADFTGECEPGTRACDGTVSMYCDSDGSGWLYGRDCAEWGSACGGSGHCEDGCGQAEVSRSYVGCEYFAAPLAQIDELRDRVFDYRIVVANPTSRPADVTVTRGSRLEARQSVVPGGLVVISLPWIEEVSFAFGYGDWESSVVPDGTYRVTSTEPVIVSQYNPFHYQAGGYNSFTNDASLLLPTHALGREHVATSYVPLADERGSFPGYIAVVGVSPTPTEVEIVASAAIAGDAGGRWEATERGDTITFTLARGEIAQVASAVPPLCDETREGYDAESGKCREEGYDVTGSIVRSDRPVAVFSGHTCAFVPFDTPACDHLETQLMPVNTWGRDFQTTPMNDPTKAVGNMLRVSAARDGTTVTFDPPIGREAIAEATLEAGEHLEVLFEAPVSIGADAPIQAAQLLLGQNIVDPPLERGDPALTVLVPEEQFRYDYVFAVPSSYADSIDGATYLMVSRLPGHAVELDGVQVEAEWTTVGGRELAIVPVAGGTHQASSTAPFGLTAYGLGSYTSYAHPAGLDLRVLLE